MKTNCLPFVVRIKLVISMSFYHFMGSQRVQKFFFFFFKNFNFKSKSILSSKMNL